MKEIKIAVAMAESGETRTCGPNDFNDVDHGGQMSAAVTWLLDAGHVCYATYWIDATLPDPVQTVRGTGKQEISG